MAKHRAGAKRGGYMPRQAICTKYKGATNSKQSQIVATSGSGLKLSSPWDYELETFQNHEKAALALAAKYGWGDKWRGGATKDGYCFVTVE